ncbi:hypothetical protein LXL04_016562 [Taraxacum kok-saghyz]
MMHGVQVRNFNDREAIICNEFGQPVGPVTEEKDTEKYILQVDHARNKAELEAMRNDIDKVVDAKMQMIIEKLPPGIAKFLMLLCFWG